MSWITKFFFSSVGRKVLMSLSGLFLCLFLTIHMAGNFQLLLPDNGDAFNLYTYQMTHSPLIKIASYITYIAILLHVIDGIALAISNRKARPIQYAKKPKGSSWASRNMALLGTIILFFIIIHLRGFWFELKFGNVPDVVIDGTTYKNMYVVVVEAFKNPLYVAIYLLSLAAISFHLWHGFQSGFQTLGINHKKYTPIIKGIGYTFAILIPLGFAIQPIFIYVTQVLIN